jgi:hypothetical protein
VYRKSTVALYVFGLVGILLALARGNPAIGASVLALAGTMGDLRVSRKSTWKIGPKLLRRTLRRVGGQIVWLAFVLLDIGGLGFALAAPVWLAPWVTINLTASMLATLSWSEDRRVQRERATAMKRQAEQVRAEAQRKLEEREHEAERQQQAEETECQRKAEQQLREAEERRCREEAEREAQTQQQAEQAERLLQAEQQLREAEERRRREEAEREALRQQQAEQAERLRQAEQQLREAEERRRREEAERDALRQQQAEQAERLRQAEQQLREADERLRQKEKRRRATRRNNSRLSRQSVCANYRRTGGVFSASHRVRAKTTSCAIFGA